MNEIRACSFLASMAWASKNMMAAESYVLRLLTLMMERGLPLPARA